MSPSCLLLVAALLTPVAAADASWAPAAVSAIETTGAATLVAWSPGDRVADAYRVYGVPQGGGPEFLGEAAPQGPGGNALPVPGGYAVSGVLNGDESDLVHAGASSRVTVYPDGPAVFVGTSSLPLLGVKVGVAVRA